MIENLQGNKVWSSTLVRTAVILLCCVGVVGGLGCATYLASSSPNPRANNYYNNPVLTDTIFALARPDAALTK